MTTRDTDVTQGSLVRSNNTLAVSLYKELTKPGENLVFAPWSILKALAMLYTGSNGKIRHTIAKRLGFPENSIDLGKEISRLSRCLETNPEDATLKLDNFLWFQEGLPIVRAFHLHLQQYYGTDLDVMDFKGSPERALERINLWVSYLTDNRITDFVSPETVNSLTRFVICNTSLFSGKWKTPFSMPDINDYIFYPEHGEPYFWAQMYTYGKFNYYENRDFQIVAFPYTGDQFSLMVFLPKERYGLAQFESGLTAEHLELWCAKFQQREVYVVMPMYTAKNHANLKDNLKQLGFGGIFEPNADWTGMSSSEDLEVGDVIHAAELEVSDKGTTAVTVTAVSGLTTSCTNPTRPVEFIADHPFMFLVRENTSGQTVFMGKVIKKES